MGVEQSWSVTPPVITPDPMVGPPLDARRGFRYEQFLDPDPDGQNLDTIVGPGESFLVGPKGDFGGADPAGAVLANIDDGYLTGWTPGGDNDFTSFAFQTAANVDAGGEIEYRVGLFRLRNPYVDQASVAPPPTTDPTEPNPWILIDFVTLLEDDGAYLVGGASGGWNPDVGSRFTRYRKQPWIGEKHGVDRANMVDLAWDPRTDLIGAGTPGASEEAQFFGPPLATDQGKLFADDTSFVTHAGGNTLAQDDKLTLDEMDPFRLSFPFPNRELSSPLELLSLRLYGIPLLAKPVGCDR